MPDELANLAEKSWRFAAPGGRPPAGDEARPPLHVGAERSIEEQVIEPPPLAPLHPLDRPLADSRLAADENQRIRLAWARLVWLLSFLAVLLAISYLVPYIAEQTQYSITRGKQRAEYDFAQKHIGESPIGEMSRAYQMVSQVVGPSVVHINTTGTERNILPLA